MKATECSMRRNLKYCWSFVKKTRNHGRIPSSMRLGDEEASDSGRIAQLFSTHFKSLYRPSIYTPLPRNNSLTLNDNIVITTSLLESSFANLKEDNHAGPDRIPSIFVKKCSASLLNPLLLLLIRVYLVVFFHLSGKMFIHFQYINLVINMKSAITVLSLS